MGGEGTQGQMARREPPSRLTTLIVLIATLVVIVSEGVELYRLLAQPPPKTAWSLQAHKDIARSMTPAAVFDIRGQIDDRMNDCDYRYVVFCRTWESECREAGYASLALKVCVETHGARQPGGQNGVDKAVTAAPSIVPFTVGAVEFLARFPGAAWHMLGQRLGDGPIAFWLGAFFVLFYVTLIIGALRLPASVRFFTFLAAVLFGLPITSTLFSWAMIPLAALSDKAVDIVAAGVGGVGVPFCLSICIGHGAHGFAEGLGRLFGRGVLVASG
jgi:hypothetical protein